MTFLERIILDTLWTRFLRRWEVIQKSKSGVRQRKHIVIGYRAYFINIPSNKRVIWFPVWTLPGKFVFAKNIQKILYCFVLPILGFGAEHRVPQKRGDQISLWSKRVRKFQKCIWDLLNEIYRVPKLNFALSPKINFYMIFLNFRLIKTSPSNWDTTQIM